MERIAQYRLERKLGEGGMGVVWAAVDERLGRTVALKQIRSEHLSEAARQRMWREARTAAAVTHPRVCRLYEIGEENGGLFLVMERVDGEALSNRLKHGAMALDQAVRHTQELLEAVGALHEAGIVHRDLKPANVMVTGQGLKLLDFGLARWRCGASEQTATMISEVGALVGTPNYMAPEVIEGLEAGPPADVFACGAILFEMIAGRLAFQGATAMAALHAVLHEQPPALAGSAAAAAVDRVIRKALAKKPEARYGSAAEMAAALAGLPSGFEAGVAEARPVRRLIVLPFRALRMDEETDFLSFSLPEALTSTLSAMPGLVVRSHLVAQRFGGAGPDLELLTRQADVDVAIAGTMLRVGDQIRVTAQMIEVPGGTVKAALQASGSMRDLFGLQDEMVRRIASSLEVQLTPCDDARLKADVPATPTAYELYLRANQFSYDRQRIQDARDLYVRALASDANYAPAWARLGRVYRLMAKYNEAPQENLARAQEAFERALMLNPDLDLAHSLYAQLETDLGRPRAAMERLLRRAARDGESPDLFVGLVYACRFCGLTRESVFFHEEARRLDPHIPTSVTHTHFQAGDYLRCLETYSGDIGYIDASALDALGHREEAMERIRKRIEEGRLIPVSRKSVTSLLALFEGRCEESVQIMLQTQGEFLLGADELMYNARQACGCGDVETCLSLLWQAIDLGFSNPAWLVSDPWFAKARVDARFDVLLGRAEEGHAKALAKFSEAGGNALLGRALEPAMR